MDVSIFFKPIYEQFLFYYLLTFAFEGGRQSHILWIIRFPEYFLFFFKCYKTEVIFLNFNKHKSTEKPFEGKKNTDERTQHLNQAPPPRGRNGRQIDDDVEDL
jgi:hypothetical protein